MPTYRTVVPLANVTIDPESRFEFTGGIILAQMPAWVRDEKMLESLSEWDRESVKESSAAFIAAYEAKALGSPDPTWTGKTPKSIQETKYELCILANLALWFRSCPASFTVVLHAPDFGSGPVGQRISRHMPLLFCPADVDTHISAANIAIAARLHSGLASVKHDEGSLWTAIRATWAGLQFNAEPVRYALLWMALEALFGPEDAREMTFRLSQRIAFFLFEDRVKAREVFGAVREAYGFRSKIVHGRWKETPDGLRRMVEIEDWVRSAFERILTDHTLRETFGSKKREGYLDDLVFR